MQETRFENWLGAVRGLSERTIGSRLSNIRRVEAFEGDLDAFYDADGLDGLIERLHPANPKHKVPINGNLYNGTATLKSAVSLYCEFRRAHGSTAEAVGIPAKRQPQGRPTLRQIADWPVWPQPADKDLLALAHAMAPLVRFLDPGIVFAVAEDNRRLGAGWASQLEGLGINPAIYLWDGSPCAFPGVRRYAGSTEIAVFRQRAASDEVSPQCLALDDNDYPKHLWSFVFTGKPFRKRGPDGYQLAHLFDHKEHGNRWRDELELPSDADEPTALYGLFTSAANTVYAPGAFLRPTDFSPVLRSLIQRRALQLYREVCRIAPPPLAVRRCDNPDWGLERFEWGDPVGCSDRVSDFLDFRRQRMDELIHNRRAKLQRGGMW